MALLLLASIVILLKVYFRPGTCLAASRIYLDPVRESHSQSSLRKAVKIPSQGIMYASSFPTFHVSSSWPHKLPNIPNTKPLIPTRAGHPPFTSKQAPIHPTHEFRMPAHPPQLPALLTTKTL